MIISEDYKVVVAVSKELMVAQQSRYERDEVMVMSGLPIPFLYNITTVRYKQIEIVNRQSFWEEINFYLNLKPTDFILVKKQESLTF